MSKTSQNISRKRANDGKISIKIFDKRVTRLEYVKQNMFKSLVETENQNIPDFVLLNKETNIYQIEKKVVEDIQDLGVKGFTCLLFSIVLNLFFVASIV